MGARRWRPPFSREKPTMVSVTSLAGSFDVLGDDELDELAVLLEVAGAGLVAGRELHADAAVPVGLVPQVVEETDHHGVVGGVVKRPVQLAVGGQRRLAPPASHGHQGL